MNECRVIAIVGLSSKPERPSYRVACHMKEHGYTVIPVNPLEKEVLGETCYPDLLTVPEAVDVVNIFRKSEDVPPIVDQAIRIKAKAIWMQEGIKNEEATLKARQAGMQVVMDKCMRKEHIKIHGMDALF